MPCSQNDENRIPGMNFGASGANEAATGMSAIGARSEVSGKNAPHQPGRGCFVSVAKSGMPHQFMDICLFYSIQPSPKSGDGADITACMWDAAFCDAACSA
jgi:hypothetical protein